ncbi:MAG: dimethylargininase [Jatrophihabitantaceae bacterium]
MTPRLAVRRHYLMCPPTHYDVIYSINPWMDPSKPVDTRLAYLQWQRIHDIYLELGHRIDLLQPLPDLPDMVFTANGATVLGGRSLVARFRYQQRVGESPAYLDWFGARDFAVRQADSINEGQGDFLAVADLLLGGTGFRSDPAAHAESEAFFGRRVIGLTLVNADYYHLDTAIGVLDERNIMYYPAAFSPQSRAMLAELFPDAVLASAEDAAAFGLNAVSDGRHVVLPSGAPRLAAQLRERGFETIGADVSELLRGGGGVKCCTLELGLAAEAAPADDGAPAEAAGPATTGAA